MSGNARRAERPFQKRRHLAILEETSKPMDNQCLSAHGFQSAQLVWPPVVLGEASWLVTWSQQVIHREFNALFRREETLDEFFVAGECVGPLVVDSWNVVDFKVDPGNLGPACDDLDEAAQRMCYREPPHDGCACDSVVRTLPQ